MLQRLTLNLKGINDDVNAFFFLNHGLGKEYNEFVVNAVESKHKDIIHGEAFIYTACLEFQLSPLRMIVL